VAIGKAAEGVGVGAEQAEARSRRIRPAPREAVVVGFWNMVAASVGRRPR